MCVPACERVYVCRILMKMRIAALLFADDSALVAHSAEEMQKIVDAFSDALKKFGLKINIKRPRCCTNPSLQEPERRISWLVETCRTLFRNYPTSEALHQVMGALVMKYIGEWPKVVHLTANYTRYSGTTNVRVKGNIYRAVHPSIRSRGLDSV